MKRRVIDVGRRSVDGLKELRHKIKTIPGGLQKLVALRNLIHVSLASGHTTEDTETNLLQPGHQVFKCNYSLPCVPKDAEYLQPL